MDEETHPLDEQISATESAPTKKRDLISQKLAVFLSSTSFCYMALDLAGVNLPRYYPVLRQFSVTPIKDQISMGFYGRVVYALAAGLAITLLFWIFSALFNRLGLLRHAFLYGVMTATVWFAAALIVVKEWHEWGLEKRELTGGGTINPEFGLFLLAVLIVGIGGMLTAAALRRGVVLSSAEKNNG